MMPAEFSDDRRKFLVRSAAAWIFLIPGFAFLSACSQSVTSASIPGAPNKATFGVAGEAIAGKAIAGKVS
jgi:hypothetical protein